MWVCFVCESPGGPGTHNGLKSLVDIFGEEFPRLRIGIGAQKTGEDLSSYVLSRPTVEEQKNVQISLQKIPELVREFVVEGIA